MLPLHIYCKATGDYSFTQVAPKKLSISLYGGARKLIVGHANVPVKHKSFECFLNCRIDDDEGCRPLPGKDVNIAMGIIAIDDANSKPDTCGKMLNYFILLRCESTPKMHLHLHLRVWRTMEAYMDFGSSALYNGILGSFQMNKTLEL